MRGEKTNVGSRLLLGMIVGKLKSRGQAEAHHFLHKFVVTY